METITRYARSGAVSIAYQVVGDGPFDIVHVPAFLSHVELGWSVPYISRFRERLAGFSRLIVFDKRGTGMSDRVTSDSFETRMDDVRAVMDASGSTRAAILGVSSGAPMSVLFAATYPERTAALVLWGGFAREMWAPDYPWGRTEEDLRRQLEDDDSFFYGPPSKDAVEELIKEGFSWEEAEAMAEYWRAAGSPGTVRALRMMDKEIDVRTVLPAVRVPTLIVHGIDDEELPVQGARYMAERIPGAQLVELPGAGHLMVGDVAFALVDEIEHFLSEILEGGAWEHTEPDRLLTTVLFTDIVAATERASQLGDRGWRELLERHHALVRRQLVRFRGVEVDTAGDGFFARFDGPARAVRCACTIVDALRNVGIDIRVGLHTGECEIVESKVTGIAVHTGARVAAHAKPGEVLVSSTVKDLVAGSGIAFRDEGVHELRGVPGEWRLFAVDTSTA